ncbi:MAG: hypothetical protein FJ145_05935 [Deltaproteobacteria bacterium]|nr:hypothetical protein [Deltaproteobacteria bacterium]
MQILQITLWLYGTALKKSLECVRKNWVVSFAPVAYGIVMSAVGMIAWRLGFLGGFLIGLAAQACISSGLHLIGNMIQQGKADFDDFIKGFTVYLWELLGIAFILWIPMRLAAMALAGVPNGGLIYLMLQIAVYVFLNPVPELVYQSRTSGLGLLSASYKFIGENWIEWFIPNVILLIGGYFLWNLVSALLLGMPGILATFIELFVLGLALTYIMLFRGFLFAELYGSTRRSREYRFRARG